MFKRLLMLLATTFLFGANFSLVFAYNIPNFTSCVNPQGEIIANYATGTHGIAGKPGLFEGKDVVYKVSEDAVTQCFCAVDGQGIQTNFWKIPTLGESEINALKAQGWIYIPNGALWGLDNVPYVAKNSDFSCKSSGGSGNGGSGGTSDSSSSGSSNNNSGSVLSASGGVGQVLGLASTGNSTFLFGTALASGLSLIIGVFLKKRSKKFSK